MAEFIITKQLNASKQQVFNAWSKAESMEQWWGPKGSKTIIKEFNLQPEGVFHYYLQSAGGQKMWGKFIYQEVMVPDKIVFVNSFSDESGNITRAPFSQTWPLEISNTIMFEENNGTTTLSLKGSPINASQEEQETFEANFENVRMGFTGTFDQLVNFLSKQ